MNDTVLSLQLMQQLQQAEAAAGKRLVLKRVNTGLDIGIFIAGFLLALPTFTISFWLCFIYFVIKEFSTDTYLVKNLANGEKFRVNKAEFKQYKKAFKLKEKEVRSISDLK